MVTGQVGLFLQAGEDSQICKQEAEYPSLIKTRQMAGFKGIREFVAVQNNNFLGIVNWQLM